MTPMLVALLEPTLPGDESLDEMVKWATVLIPLLLVFITALLRSICYNTAFFSGRNLYLGMDLAFAGLGLTLAEALNLLHEH